MIKAEKLVGLLNQLFLIDPVAAENLVNHRVECSKELLSSDVPFICSIDSEGKIQIGIVGFINAMAEDGDKAAAVYENGKLTGFSVVGDGR